MPPITTDHNVNHNEVTRRACGEWLTRPSRVSSAEYVSGPARVTPVVGRRRLHVTPCGTFSFLRSSLLDCEGKPKPRMSLSDMYRGSPCASRSRKAATKMVSIEQRRISVTPEAMRKADANTAPAGQRGITSPCSMVTHAKQMTAHSEGIEKEMISERMPPTILFVPTCAPFRSRSWKTERHARHRLQPSIAMKMYPNSLSASID